MVVWAIHVALDVMLKITIHAENQADTFCVLASSKI